EVSIKQEVQKWILRCLKKKISSYKTPTGNVTKVPDELTMEILHSWEQWTGPSSGFYSEIGVSSKKMAGIIGRGKKSNARATFPKPISKKLPWILPRVAS